MSRGFAIRPKTFQQLNAEAFPQSVGQPECFAHYWYDTQTYLDNATTQLTFFAATQADRSLSNLPTAGQLEDPQFFEIHCIMLDAVADAGFVTTAAGGVAGAIDDLGLLMVTGRPRVTLNISDKQYGPWPATLMHASGGPVGFGWGTFTAEESLQYGNNGPPDGGLFIGGSIIIPPKVGFRLTMDWPAAVNLTDDYRLKMTLGGVLHRAVR